MQRQFIVGLLLMLCLNLLVKPFYIVGIEAEVQNQLGTSVYGLYFALLNLSYLFNILLDFGINNYNTKNIAESPQVIGKYLGSLLGIRVLLLFIYAAFTLASGFVLGYDQVSIAILCWLIGNQFLVSTLQFIRSNLTGLHLFKWDSFFSVFDRMLLIFFCSALLWWHWLPFDLTLYAFIAAQTLAYGVAILIGFIVVVRYSGKLKFNISRVFSLAIFRKSWPYALLVLLMMFYNRVDGIMLERLSPEGSREAGYYAQGFRLFDAVNMIALIFAGLLLPIFSRMLKNKEDINPMVRLSSQILLTLGIIVGVSTFFYRSEIISIRYDDVSHSSIMAFGFLMLSSLPVFVTYVYGTLITASGKMKKLNQIAGLGIVANIILNFILIPQYGAFGAAVATLVTQSLTALLQFVYAYKVMHLNRDIISILRYCSLACIVIGIIQLLQNFDMEWYFSWGLALVVSSATAIFFKLWNIREILALLKSSKSN